MQARRTPETICWTDCACPVAPAWHDGGMGTLFERLAGFFEKRLGRSPRAALDATRLAIAFTGITFGVAQSRGFPMSLETFLYALLLIWGLATALLPILSWRADTRLAAFVLVVDFGILGAVGIDLCGHADAARDGGVLAVGHIGHVSPLMDDSA